MSETFSGRVLILDDEGREAFNFDSRFALLDLGAGTNEGDLRLHGTDGETKIRLDGGRSLISVANSAGIETIRLDGSIGDIMLRNADIAEEFELEGGCEALAGSLMVLCNDGSVAPCTTEYDHRVIGVVAGAGAYRPGIILDRSEHSRGQRAPISVLGKVICRADAHYGPIAIGDFLTTSNTIGHAMSANNSAKASGAIFGKALRPLIAGTGLLPVLVALG